MIALGRPDLDAREVFGACISRIRDENLKARLEQISERVAEASTQFDELASTNRLHQLVREAVIDGIISTAEMEAVYTQRMAKKNAPGRYAYDQIINSAPLGKCPLCGHRTVSTLDHHLPKASYPVLAVTPLNLLPACADCNKRKLAKLPTNASEETLHPYFDDISAELWLRAVVVEGEQPAALLFDVEPPGRWDAVLAARVAEHFRVLGLGDLYSAEAADELMNIRHQLSNLHDAGGPALVQEDLQARANSCRAARLNGWRTAAYDAFVQSQWFCDGGFR